MKNGKRTVKPAMKKLLAEHVATMKRYRLEEFSQLLDSKYRHRLVVLAFTKAEYEKLRLSAGSHEQSLEEYVKESVVNMTDTDCEDLALGLIQGRYKVVAGEAQ